MYFIYLTILSRLLLSQFKDSYLKNLLPTGTTIIGDYLFIYLKIGYSTVETNYRVGQCFLEAQCRHLNNQFFYKSSCH